MVRDFLLLGGDLGYNEKFFHKGLSTCTCFLNATAVE